MFKYGLFVFFIIFNCEILCNGDNTKKDEEFIPTHEWQIVRKDQRIPKGLHVRINFETGITEAKLLDEESKVNKDNALVEIPQQGNLDHTFLHSDDLKNSLKKIKSDDILKPDEIAKTEKFKSYEELKKEMDSLNLIPKIDAEVLRDLFIKHNVEIKKEKVDVPTVLRILEDFDFLAHQYDNGVEFVQQNGFKEVIYKNLNLSELQIKQETLKLFGSLVQNNGKAQIHVLETGGLNILLRILNLEQSIEVKSRAMYALSCLLRRFPLAQLRFLQNGGISVIVNTLENGPIKLKIKLVTLMNDLLLENIQATENNSNENHKIVHQYQLVNLENLLLEHNWCQYLNKLLLSLVVTDLEDHDAIEKCLLSMHSVANRCSTYYDRDILINLEERYKTLALNDLDKDDEHSNSDFFNNLYTLCKYILSQKNVKTEL